MHRDAIIRLYIIRKMIVRGYTRHHSGDAKQVSYSFTCDTSAKMPEHFTHAHAHTETHIRLPKKKKKRKHTQNTGTVIHDTGDIYIYIYTDITGIRTHTARRPTLVHLP